MVSVLVKLTVKTGPNFFFFALVHIPSICFVQDKSDESLNT